MTLVDAGTSRSPVVPVETALPVSAPAPSTDVDHDYLTADQVDALAFEVSRNAEVVFLLAFTGLRWGEFAALRPRDIDLERRRLHITRSASKVNSASVIGPTKTWERRSVAVPGFVVDMVAPLVSETANQNALIWQRRDSTPLRPPTTTHWFGKAVHRLAKPMKHPKTGEYLRDEDGRLIPTTDFPILSVHDLRHTAASLMIATGANVKTVQRQLGHKFATMTLDNYGHLFDDDLDSVAVALDRPHATKIETGQKRAKDAVAAVSSDQKNALPA
ncbi:site-specific integrase [Gordonia sp. CPCC 205333]|uniref:site-specific integrase n=1 Tax=Gordonia sp. CPCC 205333 TaxID=3140790 RepID=UPI003AF34820